MIKYFPELVSLFALDSFFISPYERKKGCARRFILKIFNKLENIEFTVSKFNQPSLNLFNSISPLKNTILSKKKLIQR